MQPNRGFALAATMMVLALISVLGAMAIQSATLEVQISAHDRDARAALYVAEAALDEARYYVARGWGKIAVGSFTPPQAQVDVTVTTDLPPGLLWDDHRYVDFTLVDAAGRTFPILDNVGATLALDTSGLTTPGAGPSAGRFAVVRVITGWTAPPPNLSVPDGGAVWSVNSGVDTWRGWVLYDDGGVGLAVDSSAVTLDPGVSLTLSGPLGAFTPAPTMTLCYNPWLAALQAGGSALGGDADPASPDVWDRVFLDDGGAELGRAGVQTQPVAGKPGTFSLTSQGGVGTRRHTVRLTVFRAGAPTQGAGDWVIDDG